MRPNCNPNRKHNPALALEIAEAETRVAEQIVPAVAILRLLRLLCLDIVVTRRGDAIGLHGRVVGHTVLQSGFVALGGGGVVVGHLGGLLDSR